MAAYFAHVNDDLALCHSLCFSPTRSSSFEPSSKKFLTVLDTNWTKKSRTCYLQQLLGVRNSDVDIIEVC